jgi:hypothetical protein
VRTRETNLGGAVGAVCGQTPKKTNLPKKEIYSQNDILISMKGFKDSK